MIAKLIVIGATRDIAIRRMRRALGEFMIGGIKTTIPLQSKIITTAISSRASTTSPGWRTFSPKRG